MKQADLDFSVSQLGECRIPSPMISRHFVNDDDHVLYHNNLREIEEYLKAGKPPPFFEKAGPREKIYFDPSKLKCGIVTCGGLCPGLNDVIRAIVMVLFHHYRVQSVFGFPYGYEGLSYRYKHAPNDVNYCLVPELPFTLEGFLKSLEERLNKKGHAVIVVGEGAGQDLMQRTQQRDASGNVRFGDIGTFLRDQINAHFKGLEIELNLKYIDPSYTIRSVPANAHDSAFCLLLGQNAVHAAMAGRTNMVVGDWGGAFTQDNEITWLDWGLLEWNRDMFRFFQLMVLER